MGNSFAFSSQGSYNQNSQSLAPSSRSEKEQSKSSPSSRLFSIKSRVLVLELIDADPKVTNMDIDALKQILEEQNILIPNKNSLKRFLKGVKKALKKETHTLTKAGDLNGFTVLQILNNIIDLYESEYSLKINRSDRKAIDLLEHILTSKEISKKEVKLFRKTLDAIGVPSHTYNEDFIKIYLASSKLEAAQQWSSENQPSDKQMFEFLQQTKANFDQMHYTNLKHRTQFLNIVKGFPAQFVLFQLAIGATIYREYFTDSIAYDAHTNPEPLSNFMDSLTPSAAFGFFIFILTSQYTELGIYKLGLKWDNKYLKSAAPQVGLASGFFASALFEELATDIELHKCVKNIMSPEANPVPLHISPCEHSYMEWVENKWKDYTVDIFTLLGASWISHKIVKSIALLIRSTAIGEQALFRFIKGAGPRMTGWVGFFITIFTFMEAHKVLDKLIGQPAKSRWAFQGAKEDLFYLDKNLNLLSWDTEDKLVKKKIISKIKSIGHKFGKWIKAQGTPYETAFYYWNVKTNKILLTYQGAQSLLVSLFDESQKSTLDYYASNTFDDHQYVNLDKLNAERETFIKDICIYLDQKQDVSKDEISDLEKICKDQNHSTNVSSIVKNLKQILFELLRTVNEDNVVKLKPLSHYVSNNINEFFNQPIANLPIYEKLKLAEILLSSTLESYPYGPRLEKEVRQKIFETSCEKEISEGKECSVPDVNINIITRLFLMEKAHLLGFHILKQTLSNYFWHTKEVLLMKHILTLFNPYRKGEFFIKNLEEGFKKLTPENNSLKSFFSTKPSMYNLLGTLICDSEKRDSKTFNLPQMFPELEPHLCPSLAQLKKTNFKYDPPVSNETRMHNKFFNESIKVNGKIYENIYLVLEESIRDRFKTKEALLDFFHLNSKDEIEAHSEEIKISLTNLTDNFIVPGLINSTEAIRERKTCSDILYYYSIHNSSHFKGLEISLFHIRFWANKLKIIKSLDGTNFDEESFNSTYCTVLELLKSYHDAFISGQKIKLPKQKMAQNDFGNVGNDMDLAHYLESNKEDENDIVLVNGSLILHSFLKKSYPNWTQLSSFIEGNYAIEHLSDNEQMAYAVIVELHKSLTGFFNQLSMLKMKMTFEKDFSN